jgi:GWxTD domain-containing protein
MTMSPHAKRLALCLGMIALLGSCASSRRARGLDPESREFYSKVRYIIASEERKAFLALAEADRPAFIEDFWKRRDPKPATEANEYKTEYFNRIETANHLFTGGGSPGWLQDRGRVYITLGPPDTASIRAVPPTACRRDLRYGLHHHVRRREMVDDHR